MFFCRANKQNLRIILRILNEYTNASGQHINYQKSKIYFRKGVVNRKADIINLLGMAAGITPFVYLRVPIFKGKPKVIHLQPLADKVRPKLEG